MQARVRALWYHGLSSGGLPMRSASAPGCGCRQVEPRLTRAPPTPIDMGEAEHREGGGGMPSGDHGEVRDYGFADKAVALRKRAGLTQGELAALLGVSAKAVGGWENGLFAPGAERLEQLIALYAARGV